MFFFHNCSEVPQQGLKPVVCNHFFARILRIVKKADKLAHPQELSLDDSNDTGAGEVIEGCDGCGKDAGCECGLLMSAFHDANRKLAGLVTNSILSC